MCRGLVSGSVWGVELVKSKEYGVLGSSEVKG